MGAGGTADSSTLGCRGTGRLEEMKLKKGLKFSGKGSTRPWSTTRSRPSTSDASERTIPGSEFCVRSD